MAKCFTDWAHEASPDPVSLRGAVAGDRPDVYIRCTTHEKLVALTLENPELQGRSHTFPVFGVRYFVGVVDMASLPPVRACIFDVDGTLINSEHIYTEIYNTILREYGRPDYPWKIKATQQSRGTKVRICFA